MDAIYLKKVKRGKLILVNVNILVSILFFISYLYIGNNWFLTLSMGFILVSFILLFVLNYFEDKLKNLINKSESKS